MTAARVEVTSEVFWTCHLHALSTEVEEVMGLLLGDVLHQEDGSATVRIWAAVPQIRTDRRKDRVEASPEQVARCSAKAERFSTESGTLTRVVGWYHSHPHITVLPSHVDVRTQAMYQMLDPGFIGLIISTFNEDPTMHIQKTQITAFQSVSTAAQPPQLPDVDATDIEQAMAASTAAAYSAGDWTRREVPLAVVQSHGLAEQSLSDISKALLVVPPLDVWHDPAQARLAPQDKCMHPGRLSALSSLHAEPTTSLLLSLQTLFQEERAAYEAALEDARDADGNIDPLAALQHAATYQHHLASLIEIVLGPALHSLQTCRTQAKVQRQQLDALQPVLQQALEALHEQQQQQQAERQQQAEQHPWQQQQAGAQQPPVPQQAPDVPQLASQLAAALTSGAQPAGSSGAHAAPPPAASSPTSVDRPDVDDACTSMAAASLDPWASTRQEPWAMSEEQVTEAAKARLAAEDHARAHGRGTAAPVPISQAAAAPQPERSSAVGSPDVFEELFFGLDDYGRVTSQPRPHRQNPP